MSSSAASNQSQVITNITFGIAATVISVITVWQGHRAWRLWHEHCCCQQTTFPDIELGSRPNVPAITSLEEPGNGRSQSRLTSGTSMPKASNPGSAVSHSPKEIDSLEAISALDLLPTASWQEVTTFSGAFPSPFRQSLAGSRSEIELSMPPKPTLLRNSRSLETVPHLSLH